MVRALILVVSLALAATPAFASIAGSTCTTTDPYLPGGTATMCWTCTNAGPTSNPECLDEVALGHPDGWTVACGTQDAVDSAGNPVELDCTAGGQNVTFADTDGGAGEVCPGQSWSFCVDVTAPASPTEPVCVFYTLSGDGAGGDPHEIIDCDTCAAAAGAVTIVKETLPAGAGQQFEFAGDLGPFTLAGGDSVTFDTLLPGTYQLNEVLPAGWDLADITCADPDGGTTVDPGAGTATIDVDDAETVTCTFLNTQQGSATIALETVPPGAAQPFSFAGDLGPFTLTDGESTTADSLAPGTYTVTQSVLAGWDLTQISCVDPDGGTTFDPATGTAVLDVDPGEQVACTFVDTERGSVTISKETDPAGSTQQFSFSGDLGAFSLAGGDSSTTDDLQPGAYTVAEALPAGWELTQISCTDPDGGTGVDVAAGTATIDLDPGEQISCTFLNTAQGSVTIAKETVPADAGGQQFDFTGDLGAFALTGGESRTADELTPGTYTVGESLPTGWDLTQISCTDPDGGTGVDLGTGTATIDVDPGEQITCTFLNTSQGSVTIAKETLPADAGGQQFDFTGGLGDFMLTGGESSTSTGLEPGTYAVTEALPAGWDLAGITCDDPDGGTVIDVAAGTAQIDLDGGEQITCTFLNTSRGSVTIIKDTVPADAGGQQFDFTGDLGAFALTGGQSNLADDLEPGAYAVTEVLPQGWSLTGITCDDPDGGTTVDLDAGTVSIDLDAGEQVVCTFLNTAQGSVTIVKETAPPGSDQQFGFTGDLGAFSLAGGESSTIADLDPGAYTVAEVVPDGWELTDITCTDADGGTVVDLGAGSVAIDLDAGEQVACTFLNTATVASVTIVKQTLPQGSGELFDFGGDFGPFSLAGSGSTTFTNVDPGAYTVYEDSPPAGWELIQISCDDPDGGSTFNFGTATAAIDVDPGEQITCTFSNRSDDYIGPANIPTLSTGMLLLLAGLVAVAGFLLLRQRAGG